MQVKSYVLPTTMLTWSSPAISAFTKDTDVSPYAISSSLPHRGKLHPLAGKRTNTGSIKLPNTSKSPNVQNRKISESNSLLRFALYRNDLALLKLLLELGAHYISAQPGHDNDDPEVKKIFTVSEKDFEYALEVGHSHLIAEMVKQTGAGIPLNSLAKKYGVELKEKPKYYQGLTVHGKKRKDWAQRGYDYMWTLDSHSYNPPLLTASNYGSLEAVEWLMSDSPIRCYNEFAKVNKDDKRLKQLDFSEKGFQGTVEKFLNARTHTMIHCCIAGDYTVEGDEMLRYLLQTMSESIEAKSWDGYTPLHVAFELYREDWARLLIEAGANQKCRDRNGRNLLHSLLDRGRDIAKQEHVEALKRMLDLIDKRVLTTLFTERATGSQTPMQKWLSGERSGADVQDQVLKVLLEYGGGQELDYISGDGDTPLHNTVKRDSLGLTTVILEHDATLLNRENATGRTPYEMAEDSAIARLSSSPPPMPNDGYSYTHDRAIRLGLRDDWRSDLLNRSEKSFVESDFAEPDSRSKIWKLLQKTKTRLEEEEKWKRKLVTLNEANEVARRLATRNSGSHAAENESDVESEASDEDKQYCGDEVATYITVAKASW